MRMLFQAASAALFLASSGADPATLLASRYSTDNILTFDTQAAAHQGAFIIAGSGGLELPQGGSSSATT